MKQFILTFIAVCILSAPCFNAQAAQRRPIDNEHPMWLVHVDVWNQADPQKIINLIPEQIRPYVVMNLSLSCSYDKDLDMYMRPQNAIRTYKSWATVCQNNGMWFTCQPASGGHTHIQDDDLEIFEYFFKKYPNFLGWNYAEQFWGFNEAGDKSSSSDVTRIALFAKLVRMSHEYGGFLTVSFCGNIWSHPLNPVGMMKRNADLLQACRDYPEAILWLYKYTTSSCFYNNESVTFSPFISGLAANYGVRYDNCGWNGAIDDLFKDASVKPTYPTAAGIGTVMEQTCVNGGSVWDGPELIWTEDFQNLNNSTVNGYTRRNWGTYSGFRNAWLDMWDKIIDGTMYIPTRREVVEKTKIVVINDVTSGSDEDKYAAWGDLYDGLYKQTDPFNPDNGQWMKNYCYFKKTGRYGAIPVCVELADSLAKSIPTQIKKSSKWSSQTSKTNQFKDKYPIVSLGDMYVNRFHNQLVTYTPYTYLNAKRTSYSKIPLLYNSCDSLYLTYGMLGSGIVHENAESIDIYLNNYRSDTLKKVTDVISVIHATEKPVLQIGKRVEATMTYSEEWNETTGIYTVTVDHNGPVDLSIACHGNNTEGRLTDVVPSTALPLPLQPEEYAGELIVEAEDFDWKNITNSVNNAYYSGYRDIRGHAGNGFVVMGDNKQGSLRTEIMAPAKTSYRIGIRYSGASRNSSVALTVNGNTGYLSVKKGDKGDWKKAFTTLTLKAGKNIIILNNDQGVDFLFDQLIARPKTMEEEQFDIHVRESQFGTVTLNVIQADGTVVENATSAAEGCVVQLHVQPAAGYVFKGWRCIHGSVTVDDDNTFTMPDDIVTLEPDFEDNSTVYELSLETTNNSNMPIGWRCNQSYSGTEIHEYPNSYGSGACIKTGFTGYQGKGLYWRGSYAAYGYQEDYKLYLEPGDYKLHTVMAAWKGTPTYYAQILTSNNTVLKQSASTTAAPNVDGNTSADISSAKEKTMEFTVTAAGNYIINYKSAGTGDWQEYLLAGCSLHTVPDPSAIEQLEEVTVNNNVIFDLMGRRATAGQKGITIKQGKIIMIK